MRQLLFAIALVSAGAVSRAQSAPISLVVVNGRVWTGDAARPWAEAVAVRGDRIAEVGSSAAIRKLAGKDARVVDAHGALVTPGFLDSHVHFISSGFGLFSVKLRTAATKAEFIARITDQRQLDRAVIRHKNGAALPVYYLLIPSEISELPVYIGLVWPQNPDVT